VNSGARKGYDTCGSAPMAAATGDSKPDASAAQRRIVSSIDSHVEHPNTAPGFVIPCTSPRAEGLPTALPHAIYGGTMPASQSLMLAAGATPLRAVRSEHRNGVHR
jgi:hypothetical protein